MTFHLAPGVDRATFRAADARLQVEFAAVQPGLLRRTTAEGVDAREGEWIVVDEWRATADADAAAVRWDTDAVVARFMALVDRATLDIRRYVVG
jgi:hypothetical protein